MRNNYDLDQKRNVRLNEMYILSLTVVHHQNVSNCLLIQIYYSLPFNVLANACRNGLQLHPIR